MDWKYRRNRKDRISLIHIISKWKRKNSSYKSQGHLLLRDVITAMIIVVAVCSTPMCIQAAENSWGRDSLEEEKEIFVTQDSRLYLLSSEIREVVKSGGGKSTVGRLETALRIDNEHVYDGMDKAYKSGYTPSIEDDTAIVVLPLTAGIELKDHKVTASLDLGDTVSVPFVYKNYQKTFSLVETQVKDSDEKFPIYDVRFKVPLLKDRMNGVYPLVIKVEAEDMSGNEISRFFTTYVTITDGKEAEAKDRGSSTDSPGNKHVSGTDSSEGKGASVTDPKDMEGTTLKNSQERGDLSASELSETEANSAANPSESGAVSADDKAEDGVYAAGSSGTDPMSAQETPTSSPVVLVTNYSVTPAVVTAGQNFSIEVTLTNTSSQKAVQNMVVTVSTESMDFTLKNDSNTIYIPKLAKQESTSLVLQYAAGLNTPEGQYRIDLNMTYDDPNAESLASSGVLSVPVIQALNVQMTKPPIPGKVRAGDTLPVEFQVLNLGRSKVYNVRCDISGDGLIETSTAFVGDMEPGTEGNADLNLYIGSKDMTEGYTGSELYGQTTGTITLTYEDAAGNTYTQEETFSTEIEEPVIRKSPDEEKTTETVMQWWVSVVVIAGIIAATIIGIIWKRLWVRARYYSSNIQTLSCLDVSERE